MQQQQKKKKIFRNCLLLLCMNLILWMGFVFAWESMRYRKNPNKSIILSTYVLNLLFLMFLSVLY